MKDPAQAEKLLQLLEYNFPEIFQDPMDFIQFIIDNFKGIQTRELRDVGDKGDEIYWEFRFKGSIKVYKCIIKERFAFNRDPILRQKMSQFK